MRDPYKILGVRHDAGQDEIKAAWRNMAKVVHPDHNQGDPMAGARFAEIGRAYDTLKDPKKRSLFDNAARMADAKQNGNTIMQQRQAAREAAIRAKQAQENAERVMEELARAAAQKAAAEAAKQPQAKAQTQQAQAQQAQAQSQAQQQQTGAAEPAEEMIERIFGAQARTASGGGGRSQGFSAGASRRPETESVDAAKTSEGEQTAEEAAAAATNAVLQPLSILTSLVRRFTGTAPAPEKAPDQLAIATVTIDDILKGNRVNVDLGDGRDAVFSLTPGTTEGQTVRLKGQGHKLVGMQRGDAVISIHIAPHEDFTVDGFDLHTVLPVTIENAVLGTDARIDGPNGPLTVTVPAWSGSDKSIRFEGQGLPNVDGGKGDLVVELRIILWEKPDDKVTDLMRIMKNGLFL
jgi:DnaJ-class molecular chaperone